MTENAGPFSMVRALLLATATLCLGSTPARAQWGMGYGWGWGGFGGFNYTSSPTEFLNRQAQSRAARAGPPAQNRPYAGSSNAYFNNIRDNGFVPRYDVQSRRPPAQRPLPPVSLAEEAGQAAAAEAAAASARPKPNLPIASFFDAQNRLEWPSESPTTGELKAKRDESDQACLAVLKETKENGVASISLVADARQKLLDYGRPALQEIRAVATARIADTFHLFLLSLYESLAQAASPPRADAPAP